MPPPGPDIDPLLRPFLGAHGSADAELLLARLLDEEAAPVIARVLRTKAGGSDAASQDRIAELTSAAREELIGRLLTARVDDASGAIANFRGYVAAVAYNVWAEHLRKENPRRAMLTNRVRYLLENRTTQRGFAVWESPAGVRLCGLQSMRAAGAAAAPTPKLQLLALDPQVAARDAFGNHGWNGMHLAELLAGLFRWLERPIELRDLIDALAQLLAISDEKVSMDAVSSAAEFVDPQPSPVDSAQWAEYLQWLWRELQNLSLPQRTAFLLHSSVTREFDFRGIASIRQIAAALDSSPEQFAAIWPELPHDDATIAERLRLQRQQVINLRRVARDRLGAAWRNFTNC